MYPKYSCHKTVEAFQIAGIATDDQPGHLLLTGTPDLPDVRVTPEWMAKHQPQEGGYFVQYADGYQSYSPAHAFETGYTPGPLTMDDLLNSALNYHDENTAEADIVNDVLDSTAVDLGFVAATAYSNPLGIFGSIHLSLCSGYESGRAIANEGAEFQEFDPNNSPEACNGCAIIENCAHTTDDKYVAACEHAAPIGA